MKRSLALAAALAVAMVIPAGAMAYTSPTWNLNGTYTIDFTCTAGCPAGPYPYSVTISTTSDATGAVTGTGYYVTGGGYPSVAVTGVVTGWDVTMDLTYDDPALAAYNPFALTGKIGMNGGLAGTAVDGQARTFDWVTVAGSVGLFSPRCEYGTYAGSTMVWSGFAPATGGTVTTDPLNPNMDYFVEASGTYFAGGNGLFDIEADAEYSQDAYQRANALAWTDEVRNYEAFGEGLVELYIDGAAVEWGNFNASHRYTLDVTPTGVPLDISANIYDTYAPNNTGGLCVAVYVEVDYDFDGFFAPVDNLPTTNVAKAGSAIPVKFSLGGDQGLDIIWPGYPKSHVIACASGADLDTVESTVTAGGSSLTYDSVTDQYSYVWKTQKAWAGTCRQLEVRLADGSFEYANFSFK